MKDRIFKTILLLCAASILLLTGGMVFTLVGGSLEAFGHFGVLKFITTAQWNPRAGAEQYGALAFMVGTLLTSLLALALCLPLALPVALFNGEYFKGTRMATWVGAVVDLLAGIPSIVYGLWGFYTLRPIMVALGLSDQGSGILTSAVVLAIMIVPYASSLSTEFISMVSAEMKEAAYSLGATRIEMVRRVSLPIASSGIFASYVLALGRALGETMAVTMLIGNTNHMPQSLLDTGNTMASVIANQFGEASGLKLSSLIAIGLLLFLITAVINSLAKYIMKRMMN